MDWYRVPAGLRAPRNHLWIVGSQVMTEILLILNDKQVAERESIVYFLPIFARSNFLIAKFKWDQEVICSLRVEITVQIEILVNARQFIGFICHHSLTRWVQRMKTVAGRSFTILHFKIFVSASASRQFCEDWNFIWLLPWLNIELEKSNLWIKAYFSIFTVYECPSNCKSVFLFKVIQVVYTVSKRFFCDVVPLTHVVDRELWQGVR